MICGATLDEAIGAAVLGDRDRLLPPIQATVADHLGRVAAWIDGERAARVGTTLGRGRVLPPHPGRRAESTSTGSTTSSSPATAPTWARATGSTPTAATSASGTGGRPPPTSTRGWPGCRRPSTTLRCHVAAGLADRSEAGRRPRRGGPDRRARAPHPDHDVRLARRDGGRRALLQVREPPADRRLQDPWRDERGPLPLRRGSGAGRRLPLLGQPRPGPRPRGTHPRDRGPRGDARERRRGQAGGGRRLRRPHHRLRADGGEPQRHGGAGRRRHRGGRDPPVRRRSDHRRAGHRGARAAGRRAGARHHRGARRWWWAAVRDRARRRPGRPRRCTAQSRPRPTMPSDRSAPVGCTPATGPSPWPTAC